jgi:hypothetical protein
MKRSDTLAAQVAAFDMVLTAIEEGRDMRAFVGGALEAAKRERDAALEAEYQDAAVDRIAAEVFPVGTAYAERIAAALDAKDIPTHSYDDEAGYDEVQPRCDICRNPQWLEGDDWNGDTGNHLSCEAAEPEPEPFSDAISVRANIAFGLWPPQKGE